MKSYLIYTCQQKGRFCPISLIAILSNDNYFVDVSKLVYKCPYCGLELLFLRKGVSVK